MRQNYETVRVAEALAPNLMLRGIANRFFDQLENSKKQEIIVDFRNVRSISRSFAHQYILRKQRSSKEICEVNVGNEIDRMFKIVERQIDSHPQVDIPPPQRTIVVI